MAAERVSCSHIWSPYGSRASMAHRCDGPAWSCASRGLSCDPPVTRRCDREPLPDRSVGSPPCRLSPGSQHRAPWEKPHGGLNSQGAPGLSGPLQYRASPQPQWPFHMATPLGPALNPHLLHDTRALGFRNGAGTAPPGPSPAEGSWHRTPRGAQRQRGEVRGASLHPASSPSWLRSPQTTTLASCSAVPFRHPWSRGLPIR